MPKYLDQTGLTTFKSKLDTTYAKKNDVYDKTAADGLLSAKANSADVYTKAQVDSAIAGAGLPIITIAASQVISQSPLQIQLTDEQFTTTQHGSVIFDGSALGVPSVVADYDGQYTDDDGVTYLDFVFNYGGGHSLYLNRILVNPSTKVATYRGESTYPVYAKRAYEADLVIYRSDTPTSANTRSGALQIIVLSSEPATRYDGYLYIITGSN